MKKYILLISLISCAFVAEANVSVAPTASQNEGDVQKQVALKDSTSGKNNDSASNEQGNAPKAVMEDANSGRNNDINAQPQNPRDNDTNAKPQDTRNNNADVKPQDTRDNDANKATAQTEKPNDANAQPTNEISKETPKTNGAVTQSGNDVSKETPKAGDTSNTSTRTPDARNDNTSAKPVGSNDNIGVKSPDVRGTESSASINSNTAPKKSPDVRNVNTEKPQQASKKSVQPKLPEITLKNDGEYLVSLMVGYFDTRGAQRIKENCARARKSLQTELKNSNDKKRKAYLSEVIKLLSQIETDIQVLLETKNTISSIIEDKVNFEHLSFKDTLLTFFYMLSYIDMDKLKETARQCKLISSSNKNVDIKDLGENLDKFCAKIEDLTVHLEDLLSKSDKNLLQRIDGITETNENKSLSTEGKNADGSVKKEETSKTESSSNEKSNKEESDIKDTKADSNKSKETTKTIPQRWPDLSNLLAAFKRYAATQPRKDLSDISDAEELMRSVLTNLNSIERKDTAITKAIKGIKDAQEEWEEATTSRRIRLLNNVMSAYNNTIADDKNFNAIPDDTVSGIKMAVFLADFDMWIEKLEKIKEEGNLRGKYATVVEETIDNLRISRQQFKDKAVSATRKMELLEKAIVDYNEAIDKLKGRESSDKNWTEVKEKLDPISADSKKDILEAYKNFASINKKTTKDEEKSTISRSPSLDRRNDTSRVVKEDEKKRDEKTSSDENNKKTDKEKAQTENKESEKITEDKKRSASQADSKEPRPAPQKSDELSIRKESTEDRDSLKTKQTVTN